MDRYGPFIVTARPFQTAERYTVYSISAVVVRKDALMEVVLRQQISKPDFDQCGSAASAAYNAKIITRKEYNLLCKLAVESGYRSKPAQPHVIAARVPHLGLTNAEFYAAKESIEQLTRVAPRRSNSLIGRIAA